MLRLLLLICLSNSLWGVNWHHAPYAPWQEVEGIGIKKLKPLLPEKSLWGVEKIDRSGEEYRLQRFAVGDIYLNLKSYFKRMNDDDNGDNNIYLSISSDDEDSPSENELHFSIFAFIGPLKVYEAYLNDDEIKDVIIVKYTGGNGSGAWHADVGFLLSSPQKGGYNFQVLPTIFTREDFLVINDTKCFIQSDLNSVEKCNDGKLHNFFVYHLVVFDDDSIRINNEISERFPKAVWWSFKPNYAETDLLTKSDKDDVARRSLPEIENKGFLSTPKIK